MIEYGYGSADLKNVDNVSVLVMILVLLNLQLLFVGTHQLEKYLYRTKKKHLLHLNKIVSAFLVCIF